MTAKNPISATVNFDQDGVQHGFLKLPHSYDNSGWGSMMLLELDAASMYDTAAENQGKIFIGTELAGGGSACAATIAITKKGIHNILRHAGITQGGSRSRS
jgi:predicted deacylase